MVVNKGNSSFQKQAIADEQHHSFQQVDLILGILDSTLNGEPGILSVLLDHLVAPLVVAEIGPRQKLVVELSRAHSFVDVEQCDFIWLHRAKILLSNEYIFP